MNARIPTQTLPQPTLTTVFTSGNSQAVRLPKKFRFNTKQVTIERRGDEIVLRAKMRSLGQSLREAPSDTPPLTEKEARGLERALAIVKNQGPQEERAMWADPQFWSAPVHPKPPLTRRSLKSAPARSKS